MYARTPGLTATPASGFLQHRAAAAMIAAVALLLIAVAPVRAQGAAPESGHPTFTVERVQVAARGATLVGDLYRPLSGGPHAAALFAPGARDSDGSAFTDLFEHLVERGVAVLALNKRGVGGSTGRWDRQTFQGRVEDVLAGVRYLQTRADVDPARVGLLGHSQGGWIAQLAAAQSAEIAFTVLLAGPGQTVRDQILTDERIHLERRGTPPGQVERQIASLRRQLSLAAAGAPVCRALRAHYICHIIRFDPTPALEQLRVPVLALFAELDPMVPPEPNVELLQRALERAGNPDLTIHVFPQANHVFWQARTGLRDEYHQLEPAFVPGFVETVGDWVVERFGVASAASGGVRESEAP